MIRCDDIVKIYKEKGIQKTVLNGITFEVESGEFIVIIGNNGSGKSTLINIIGLIESPTSGKLTIEDSLTSSLLKKDIERYKRDIIGYVFQNKRRNLINDLTLDENIKLFHKGHSGLDSNLINILGIDDICNLKTSSLSEKDIVKAEIAIAIVNKPRLLLMDEPLLSLAPEDALDITRLIKLLNKVLGITILITTSNTLVTKFSDETFYLQSGKLNIKPSDSSIVH